MNTEQRLDRLERALLVTIKAVRQLAYGPTNIEARSMLYAAVAIIEDGEPPTPTPAPETVTEGEMKRLRALREGLHPNNKIRFDDMWDVNEPMTRGDHGSAALWAIQRQYNPIQTPESHSGHALGASDELGAEVFDEGAAERAKDTRKNIEDMADADERGGVE